MAAKLRRAAAGRVEEVGALAAACDDESREGIDRGAAVRNMMVVVVYYVYIPRPIPSLDG